MPAPPRRTTIAEVAAHAGVSPATVSRVMNGRFVGDSAVADRVRRSAETLQYRPSPLARGLALGRTRTIAFVVPDLGNPAFQAMLSSLSRAAGRDRYRVLVADTAETPADEPEVVSEIRRRCDAIVLCAPRMPDQDLEGLVGELAPLVLINRAAPTPAVPALSIDYLAGIHQIAEHLYGLGHRRFAYVAGPPTSASEAGRRRGLTLFESERTDVVVERIPGGAGIEEGRRAASSVHRTGATAALAFNDLVAIGLLDGLGRLGIRVPDDVSVTGFDDIPFARHTAPPLTTASVPHGELGAQAWHRVRALVENRTPEHNVVFQPRLEVRGSTAAPAGAAVGGVTAAAPAR